MENKIKITLNGQSFELPVDTSLIAGLMGSMGMEMPKMVLPRPMPIVHPVQMPPQPVQFPHERLEQSSQEGLIQSSHERLEENFFNRFEEDLESCKNGGRSDVVERILAALIALHKRVKVLEKQVSQKSLGLRMNVVRNNIAGLERPMAEQEKPKKQAAKKAPKKEVQAKKKPKAKKTAKK